MALLEQSTAVAGAVIAERYRLLEPVGQGGAGVVWRAEHAELGTPLALKLLNATAAQNHVLHARAMREAHTAAKLRSPHVVQILDAGTHGDVPYIAMELLTGESLRMRLDGRGKLVPADTLSILTQAGRALALAHAAGIAHRDFKPENIFIEIRGGQETVKVLDFGVAKLFEQQDGTFMTRTGERLGTPLYMSPEQLRSAKEVDHRVDLWAMAIIAYECLLGVRPFEAKTIGQLAIQLTVHAPPVPSTAGPVPPGFDRWFARATTKDIDDRYASCADAIDGLRGALDS